LQSDNSPYYTIPAKAHKQFTDTAEIQVAINSKSLLKEMISTSYNMELIAYPNKAAYEENGLIKDKTIEQSESKSPPLLKFIPDTLHFGYR